MTPQEMLDITKKHQINRIIDKTEALIVEKGFIYDGTTFDLDAASQTKWLTLKILQGTISFPVDISPRSGVYTLTEANLDAFLAAGLAVVQGYKDSGRLLRLQVEAAPNIDDLIVIVDNRT